MQIKLIQPKDLDIGSVCICDRHQWNTHSEGISCRVCVNNIRGVLFHIGRFGSYDSNSYWNTRMEAMHDTISRSTYASKQYIVEVRTTNAINTLKYEREQPKRFNELVEAAIARYNMMEDDNANDNES